MKKILNKTKFILPSLMMALTLLVNTNIVSAIDYPYSYPYVVVTTVPPPPTITVTLSATVNPVIYPGQNSTTLVWSTTGSPNTCTGTEGFGSWPGAKNPTSGTAHQELQSGLIPGIYNYKMICVKDTAVANANVMVVVDDNTSNPTTVTLSASPNPVDSGSSSNLAWLSSNAVSCQTGSGPWLNPGSRPLLSGINPESTGPLTVNTTYEIICTDSNNVPVSALATVYINAPQPPSIVFRATPNIINFGDSSSLSWSTTNATSCTTLSGPWLNPGSRGTASLAESTGPLTTQTTYGIRCTGPNGSTDAYATVYVNPEDEDPLPPEISYFQPFSCVSGGDSGVKPRFSWSSSHASSCTITRLTSPQIDENVGVSSQASGGSLEFDGLYYYLSSLPVVGSSSNYRLQCVNGPQVATEYAAVNTCSPDFSLGASPILRSFTNGTNPGTGNPGKIATYVISVTPISGFSNPVALSIQSYPTMPASTSFTFSRDIVIRNGSSYETSILTIGIDLADFPIAMNTLNGRNLAAQIIMDDGDGGAIPIDGGGGGGGGPSFSGTPTVYTPIVVQGVGGGFTRTVTIGADATGKTRPIYIER